MVTRRRSEFLQNWQVPYLEPWLLQEDMKGFNLMLDLKVRLFLSEWHLLWDLMTGITVHLAIIYLCRSEGRGIQVLKHLHKLRRHYLCQDGRNTGARERILVLLEFNTASFWISLWIWLLSNNSCASTHTD